jgi:nucleotide-binding universal stress UspA family protein
MTERSIARATSTTEERTPALHRLLFIADAAVAAVEELPPAVRSLMDAASEVYVVTPTLPGRLAWLADDVDRCRHVADDRLDSVLGHLRSIGVDAAGLAGRGSIMRVITDAVEEFAPEHILVALRTHEHANWQERRLLEHIEQRFGLPLSAYAVDPAGHASTADGPVLLCYDGSEEAAHAIERAGALLTGRRAVVLTVWQPLAGLSSIAWSGAGETPSMVDFTELDRAAAEKGDRLSQEGARIAEKAGLNVESVAIKASGTVWKTILELAEAHDAATIVMGSRGLSGLWSTLLGSVSSAVAHHADRPTLIVRQPDTAP